MRGKFFLILLSTIILGITGIQPVLAQPGYDADPKPATQEKPAKEGEAVININAPSDKEFTQALETAEDVELVSEDAAKNAKNAKNDKNSNQGKSK